jgi:hypothetical protein
MEIGRGAIERQTTVDLNRAPEPPEEQEEVADAYALVVEMRLRSVDLPE